MTKIIAMWSGPRNLSTAMMRSFGARDDCSVMDEPFYAAYLAKTGLKHPLYQEIIDCGETDPQRVVSQCLAPSDHTVGYQKHMCHHMVDGFPLDWLDEVTNVFLLRDPARVLKSYAMKRQTVTAADIGFHQQRLLFDRVIKGGGSPVAVDASDIRAAPEKMLRQLCDTVGIAFDPAMLSWPAGARSEDGIWAQHWYDAVWQSTGFAPAEEQPPPSLPHYLAMIDEEVRGDYDVMRASPFALSL